MVKQLIVPAQLVLRWADRLLDEANGSLNDQQKQDVREIVQNAQMIVDYLSPPKFDVETEKRVYKDTSIRNGAAEQMHQAGHNIRAYARMCYSLPEYVGQVNDFQKTVLQRIERTAKFFDRAIMRLFDIEKIAAPGDLPSGRRSPIFEETLYDVRMPLEGAIAYVQQQAKDSSIEIYTTLDPNLPLAFGDRFRTQQILQYILSSCLKFARTGTLSITAFPARHSIQIDVTDGKLSEVSYIGSLRETDPVKIVGDMEWAVALHITRNFGGNIWIDDTAMFHIRFSTTPDQLRRCPAYNIPRQKFKRLT